MSTETKKVDYKLLGRVHSCLRQLTDIADRMRRGPIRVKVAKSNELAFGTALEEKKEEVLKAKKESKAKQMQLDEREAKLVDLQNKLNAAESNKEFQLIKDRIAADEQANSVQSDEILEGLEKLDVLESELAAAKENLQKSQAETKAVEEKVQTELADLKNLQAQVQEQLTEAEKKLHGDLAGPYRHSVKTKGEDTLASTDGSTCGNCHQTIRPQKASELRQFKPVVCEGCGAILYRNQD